jgi:hypothetical protein
MNKIKVTGKCDVGCGKNAMHWYGNTSTKYCGSIDCSQHLNNSYEELSKEIDEQKQLENDMIEQWGDPDGY